jgi:DNA polymerase-1
MKRKYLNPNVVINPRLEDLPTDCTHWVVDTETDGLEVAGDNARNAAHYLGACPTNNLGTVYIWTPVTEKVRRFFDDKVVVGHNIKFDVHAAELSPDSVFDTMLAVYHSHTTTLKSLDFLAKTMGIAKIPTPELMKEGRIHEIPETTVASYLADDVAVTGVLFNKLWASGQRGWPMHHDLSLAVQKMEARGVKFLPEEFDALVPLVEREVTHALARLKEFGFEGNLNSPIQVGEWLTKSRGLKIDPTPKSVAKGKPRPKTDKLTLEKLLWKGHIEIDALLQARRMIKLQQAFLNTMKEKVRPSDGRVYANVHISRTRTGRFSYSEPNLQQVPKHSELGKRLRYCFTGPHGIVSVADYSQVEMRVAAALSGEPVLLDAFDKGEDIHLQVAAKVLGKSPDNVGDEERFGAKAINFGILNGMGANRLSHELKSDVNTAQRWLDEYQAGLPTLTDWMNDIWSTTELTRVVKTLSGRTRVYLKDEPVRSAISVVVQGTAADIMAAALVACENEGLKPLLVVHDEVVADTDDCDKLVVTMEQAANTLFPTELGAVRFEADGYTANTWGGEYV